MFSSGVQYFDKLNECFLSKNKKLVLQKYNLEVAKNIKHVFTIANDILFHFCKNNKNN